MRCEVKYRSGDFELDRRITASHRLRHTALLHNTALLWRACLPEPNCSHGCPHSIPPISRCYSRDIHVAGFIWYIAARVTLYVKSGMPMFLALLLHHKVCIRESQARSSYLKYKMHTGLNSAASEQGSRWLFQWRHHFWSLLDRFPYTMNF